MGIKILFDDQTFNLQKFGGISRYFTEIIARLPSYNAEPLLPLKRSDNIHLLEKKIVSPQKKSSYNFRGKGRLKSFFGVQEKTSLPNFIKKNEFDIFHPTYYGTEFLKIIGDKPFVLTVHDMIHELYFNEKFESITWETSCKEILLTKAKAIVAVSSNTKNDILKLYPDTNPDKIKVIYHGNPFENIESHHLKSAFAAESKPYILYVGHRKFYKNFYWSLEVLANYIKETDIQIICAGGGKFDEFENRRLKLLGVGDNVRYHEIESDDDLFYLYANALCFLYPSLYEGFGIPVIEAFASGCPVLLSRNGCFEEVAGEAAAYFNLNDSLSLLQSIESIVNDKGLQNKLRDKGYEQVKKYSWDKCAKEHAQLYESIK